jgi:hypothetical protein
MQMATLAPPNGHNEYDAISVGLMHNSIQYINHETQFLNERLLTFKFVNRQTFKLNASKCTHHTTFKTAQKFTSKVVKNKKKT